MIGVPFSNGFNVILIVIEQLIKKRYYILYTKDQNNTMAEAITYLLFNNIWKLYHLLLLLISD